MRPHLVNIHIPKSAGTALRKNLAQLFPDTAQGEKFILGARPIEGRPYHDGLAEDFATQFPSLFDISPRLISGHLIYRNISEVISPDRHRVTLMTFLRDPIWRTLSDYFYSISEAHDGPDEFASKYPTFDHYMSNPGEMNKMTDFLCMDRGASAQDTLHHVCRAFDFVGVMENFTNDFQFIANALGKNVVRASKENQNLKKDEMVRAHEKYSKALRSVLHEDYFLYDGVLKHRGLAW